jgi:hypothetical protein
LPATSREWKRCAAAIVPSVLLVIRQPRLPAGASSHDCTSATIPALPAASESQVTAVPDVPGTIAVPLTASATVPPLQGVPPMQSGWFQVAPVVSQGCPTVLVCMLSPNPVPSTHGTVTACNDSVAGVGGVASAIPVPRVVIVSVTRVTVARPCRPGGKVNASSPRIRPAWPFSPV